MSAKFIAASWNLPLYRLDLAAIQGQYLGQSEGRLKDALTSADNASPCILWIDEVEKGLAGATGSSDGGTSTRMVGQFLFWLQLKNTRFCPPYFHVARSSISGGYRWLTL